MFYRLTINVNVRNPIHIDEIKTALRLLFRQAETINPGQPNSEQSYITLQKCYHDEAQVRPCEIMEHVETPP